MNFNNVIRYLFRKNISKVCTEAQNMKNPSAIKRFHTSSFSNQKVSGRIGASLTDARDVTNQTIMRNTNKYTERTCTCGELQLKNVGQQVTLCGWLEYQRMNKFIVLRDGYGQTQLIIKENDSKMQQLFGSVPYESIIRVDGTVVPRPSDMIKKNQATGEIEVLIDNSVILNTAANKLPFNIREYQKAKEALRMQYRYLDLRFPQMQRNLRTRSRMLMDIREFLVNYADFVDVETPTLFKATPGGAQEFVVPTRFPGQFYSLVQSPQQFKQMLMAGGIDRYFQIARCYRDEGSRPDRQPEFSQLDIEMSFTNIEGVMGVVEDLLQYSWPAFLEPLPQTFPRISYSDAMQRYGTDKPDTRFGSELQNCTDLLKSNENLITPDFQASCLVFDEPLNVLPKSLKDTFTDLSKKYPEAKFVQSKVGRRNEWIAKIKNLLGEDVAAKIYDRFNLKNGSVIFFAFGPRIPTLSLLGKIRLEYVAFLEGHGNVVKQNGMHMLWVTDFPLFEKGDTPGSINSAHHPFTAPHPDDLDKLDVAPLEVRALAYDLVLNGNEVGGGSIRIHDPYLQEKLFSLLNINKNSMQHILDMLGSGCPPHGGIALGLDRLLSVILGTPSIRDVIAFPKTFEGRDPVSGAPSVITERDKRIYHIQTIEDEKK